MKITKLEKKQKTALESTETQRVGPVLQRSKTKIGRSVVPLFETVKNGRVLEIVGSGVLLSCGSNLFLISAEHVLEAFGTTEIWLPASDGTIVHVEGVRYRSRLPEPGTHKNDRVDAAVLLIQNDNAKLLLPNALTLEDIYVQSEVLRGPLAIFGHPVKGFYKEGQAYGTQLVACSFSGEPRSIYRKLGYHPRQSLLMIRNKYVFNEQGRMRIPKLEGMSGGGVFIIPELLHQPWPTLAPLDSARLIGIFTDDKRLDGVLIATNISEHLSMIFARHPDCFRIIQDEVNRVIHLHRQV